MLKKVMIGILAGFVSGFFASGGGLILVPAFVYLFALEEDKARATSIFAILPMVAVSSFFYHHNDLLNWEVRSKNCYRWNDRWNNWFCFVKKIFQ